MYTLTQYLQSLDEPQGLLRTLDGITLCRHADGRPIFHCGNSAIVFKARLGDRLLRLRCYTRRPQSDLEAIYGENLRREELYIYLHDQVGRWVDVVVEDWIEGDPLDAEMQQAVATEDRRRLSHLAREFDRLAGRLVCDDWAHGDLKPENILVDQQGELRLIDFDSSFLPAFAGRRSPELGTRAYQHPNRSAEEFDRWLDHFPATLISVQLHALALDPSLHQQFPADEGFLLHPGELATPSKAYETLLDLFARHCDPIRYGLLLALRQSSHRLEGVEELLNHHYPPLPPQGEIELFVEMGRCGYRSKEGPLLPPIFDEAFDFHEGWAAVRLGRWWHYIDRTGRCAYTAPPACEALKSIRKGCARYRFEGQWQEIKVK